MPPLRAAYGGHIPSAVLDLLKTLTCATHEMLPRQRQADAAVVPLKQRGTKFVFKIADATADR
ncbi:hypothetical protein QU42_05205 [Bradyrhizobium sp. UASWS1016]|nr:hypothetical protein QU41_10715 [Bradyrhizobium elkanii]OCX32032.1 hypothetical protein QU42_05205 [Bradyrhizobium sp. UASWS1016]OJY08846.1 MAG: hypothetical protein BGP05_11380 [Rhizobiales bacterium 62-47]BEV45835.1 hypothetical protein CRBSH125_20180 [Afipia carboxidovorans]